MPPFRMRNRSRNRIPAPVPVRPLRKPAPKLPAMQSMSKKGFFGEMFSFISIILKKYSHS
jgi:hypothetical protein